MPDLPPFIPRTPLSKSKLKSISRRIKFLNIARNRTPQSTTNAACTHLRLRRKHIAERKQQLDLIELLERQLEALSMAEPSTLQTAHRSELLITDHLQVLTRQHPSRASTCMPLSPTIALSQLQPSSPSRSHQTAHIRTFIHFHTS
jgi:hypothetical protein